jgi:predicted dehydrogenase
MAIGGLETLKNLLLLVAMTAWTAAAQPQPLKVGIAGLVHGHAGGFFRNYMSRPDLNIVGVSEPDRQVSGRYIEQYKIPAVKVFASHAEMLDKTKPEAVMIFSNTFDHKEIVELCAARKIPVMMEKPLAVSNAHAKAIAAAAKRSGIPVMVNYETTWYPVNVWIDKAVKDGKLGGIRRIVTHYGHQGPKEIGVQPEFFSWLTDPVKNGAGAMFDFGCYGANFATWLFNNERPISVFAVAHVNKPDIYPKVEDEATIVVQYPKAQLIIQPSWNWPFSRKDMEIYGQKGYFITSDPRNYRTRTEGMKQDQAETAGPLPTPEDDVVHYLAAVVRRQIQPSPSALSSLENNLIVTEILEAAKESARTGRAIRLR